MAQKRRMSLLRPGVVKQLTHSLHGTEHPCSDQVSPKSPQLHDIVHVYRFRYMVLPDVWVIHYYHPISQAMYGYKRYFTQYEP